MVKYGLSIKASLKNVDKLYPYKPESFTWLFKVKCTGCMQMDNKFHPVSEDEVFEFPKTKANFYYKCKICQQENLLSVIPSNQINIPERGYHKKHLDTVYLSEDDEKFKTIISFDCRGMELVEYKPGDGWTVQSRRKIFNDISLSTLEWFDYNDIDNLPVEITDFDYKFVIVK